MSRIICCAVLLLAGCAGSHIAQDEPQPAAADRSWSAFNPLGSSRETVPLKTALKSAPVLTADGIKITVLDGDNNPAPELLNSLRVDGDWPSLAVYAEGPVASAALYIAYDADEFHASRLDTDRPDAIGLATEYEPGMIAVGVSGLHGNKLDPALPLVSLEFAAGASAAGRTVTTISQRPEMAVNDLEAIDNGEEAATLAWSERNPGDYDLNSEVNAADITPIALNYLKSYTVDSPDYAQLEVVDGDANTEINAADITPIAINFSSRILGYNVYRMAVGSPDDMPTPDDPGWSLVPNNAEPSGPSAPRQTGSQDFRYRYTFNDLSGAGDYAWYVAPVGPDGNPKEEGPASNVVVETVTPDQAPPAGLSFEIMPPNGPLMNLNDEFYLAIKVDDVVGLFSANIRFEYDASLVEFVEAVPAYDTNLNLLEPPLFIAADDINPADPPYVLLGFNATQTQGTATKDGSGYLGFIKFKAIAAGINDEAFRFPQSSNFIYLWGPQYAVPAATPVLGSPQIVNIG